MIKCIGCPILWTPVSLQSLLSLPFVLMNKVTLFTGMEVMQWLGNMDSHSSRWNTRCLICWHKRPTVSPQKGTIPQGYWPATWMEVVLIVLFALWKEQHFVLYEKKVWIWIYLNYPHAFNCFLVDNPATFIFIQNVMEIFGLCMSIYIIEPAC